MKSIIRIFTLIVFFHLITNKSIPVTRVDAYIDNSNPDVIYYKDKAYYSSNRINRRQLNESNDIAIKTISGEKAKTNRDSHSESEELKEVTHSEFVVYIGIIACK